jgi:sugar phosphate isomerase/epimerase
MSRRYALAYSTCGFAAGRTMIELVTKLAELGYEGVELELDRERFHPHTSGPTLIAEVARLCRAAGLRMVIGTGGRHVLTQNRHYPGAVTHDPAARNQWIQFAKDALTMAADMAAECVMVHSGYAPDGVPQSEAWRLLVDSMAELATHATKVGQRVAVEWHPEMFLSDASGYLRLHADAGAPASLGCTLDVGHAHCTEDDPPADVIRRLASHTIHVQLEDMRDRVHKHLRLGEGELDFEAVFDAFNETRFAGIVALEFNAGDLDSTGDDLAETSLAYLSRLRAIRGAALRRA